MFRSNTSITGNAGLIGHGTNRLTVNGNDLVPVACFSKRKRYSFSAQTLVKFIPQDPDAHFKPFGVQNRAIY
jgi:hypothetical protein